MHWRKQLSRGNLVQRLNELERRAPSEDGCLNCHATCPREDECIYWTLHNALRELEQAKRGSILPKFSNASE